MVLFLDVYRWLEWARERLPPVKSKYQILLASCKPLKESLWRYWQEISPSFHFSNRWKIRCYRLWRCNLAQRLHPAKQPSIIIRAIHSDFIVVQLLTSVHRSTVGPFWSSSGTSRYQLSLNALVIFGTTAARQGWFQADTVTRGRWGSQRLHLIWKRSELSFLILMKSILTGLFFSPINKWIIGMDWIYLARSIYVLSDDGSMYTAILKGQRPGWLLMALKLQMKAMTTALSSAGHKSSTVMHGRRMVVYHHILSQQRRLSVLASI